MTPIVNREILFERLGLKENKRNILVAFHAVTAEANPLAGCAEMLNALAELPDTSLLLLGTNSDNGSREITEWFKLYIATHDSRWMFRENLPPEDFYGCLQHFDCMIGNSSAGLIETARFGIPVVNIGCRQKGRSTPANVFNCAPTSISIKGTLEVVLAGRCPPAINPYGDGHSAPRIAKIMVEHLVRGDLTS